MDTAQRRETEDALRHAVQARLMELVRTPSQAESSLKRILTQSYRMSHTCSVAHAVGIYPA